MKVWEHISMSWICISVQIKATKKLSFDGEGVLGQFVVFQHDGTIVPDCELS